MARHLLTLILAAVMAMASVTLAVAQHGQAGATQMVLCTDAGDAVIYLDAQGNPVPSGHVCPDCVMALAALDMPAETGLALPPLTSQVLVVQVLAGLGTRQVDAPLRARGPPLLM